MQQILVRVRWVGHVELQHSSDEQLGLHDSIPDQPELLVLLRGLNRSIQGAVDNTDNVANAHWFVLDLGGQVAGSRGDELQERGIRWSGKCFVFAKVKGSYKFIIFTGIDLRVEPVIEESSRSHSQGLDVELLGALIEEFRGQTAFVFD